MMILPKQFLAILKRALSVSAIALATNGAANATADLVPAPALLVATMQAPKKARPAGGIASATDTALPDRPPIA